MLLVNLPETDNAYVTIDEIRNLANLGDSNRYTDDDLARARTWFETKFERYVGKAFVPRLATTRLSGSACSELMLPHYPVQSVSAVRIFTTSTLSTAYTVDELADVLADRTGTLTRISGGTWPSGNRNVEVDYVHGELAPPEDLKEEALVAIQEKLLEHTSGRPVDRTYGVASEGVFVRNILPGKDHPFGIASVDQLANEYRALYWVPAVA